MPCHVLPLLRLRLWLWLLQLGGGRVGCGRPAESNVIVCGFMSSQSHTTVSPTITVMENVLASNPVAQRIVWSASGRPEASDAASCITSTNALQSSSVHLRCPSMHLQMLQPSSGVNSPLCATSCRTLPWPSKMWHRLHPICPPFDLQHCAR